MPSSKPLSPDIEILKSQRVFDSFLKVDQVTLRHRKFDQSLTPPLDRLVISKPNSVGILLHHPQRKSVILVEQFRYPTSRSYSGWLTEIVAGNIDEGELPLETVKRETLEETGYLIDECTFIGQAYSTPGICSEKVYMYYARVSDQMKVSEEGGLDEDGEDIRLVEWPTDELQSKLRSNNILDMKTLIAIQWFVLNKDS